MCSLDNEDSMAAADAICGVFDSICTLQQRKADGLAAAAAAATPLASPPAGSETGSIIEAEVGSPGEGGAGAANSDAIAAAGSADAASPMTVGSAGGSSSASAAGGSSGPASVAGSSATAAGGAGHGSAAKGGRPTEARMLVDSQLVGYLVGRGGATIKDTVARSGATVRILPKPDLPACACIGDEVVRVSGSAEAVAAALRLLAGQIKAHPLRLGALSHDCASSSGGGGSSYGGGPQLVGGLQPPPLMLGSAAHPDHAFMHPSLGGSAGFFPGGGSGGAGAAGLMAAFCGTAVEVTFRLLTPVNRTGNIIGKGGEHVKRVRSETGARIKVRQWARG